MLRNHNRELSCQIQMPTESDLKIRVEVKDHHPSSALCAITVTTGHVPNLQSEHVCLTGDIYGPVCKRSHTLPSRASIIDTSSHGTLTASATVLDPTPWSPELPATYLATVHASIDGDSPSTCTHQFGFKSLEIRNDSFYINQRRFVPRLAQLEIKNDDASNLLDVITEEHLCLATSHPTHDLLELATEQGCWVLIMLDGSEEPATVLSWCKHPACFAMVLMSEASIQLINPLRDYVTSYTLLGQQITAGQVLSEFVQFVTVDANELEALDITNRPIVVTRNDRDVSIENGRRGCELIQRDATVYGDFAGYAVLISATPDVD